MGPQPEERYNPPMTSPALAAFIAQASARSRQTPDPADCVLALAPLMLDLIEHAGTFLEPQHYRCSNAGYTRNLIFNAADESLSLYSLVWLPGQWTLVQVDSTDRRNTLAKAFCRCLEAECLSRSFVQPPSDGIELTLRNIR